MLMRRRAFFRLLFSLPVAAGMGKRLGIQTGCTPFLLNRFRVAGFQYYDGPALLEANGPNDWTAVPVNRERAGGKRLFERGPKGRIMFHPPLKPGSKLTLHREPENPYDGFAVEIYYGATKLGYVPRTDNIHISRLLGQGAHLICRAVEVDPQTVPWKMVKAEVRMVA